VCAEAVVECTHCVGRAACMFLIAVDLTMDGRDD
jgi:hypothetical protein